MSLGDKILDLRKKNGLSQEGLGEKIDVTRQTISNWELNETQPNPTQLKALSKALNVSIDDLLENDLQNVVLSKVKVNEKQICKLKKVLKGVLIGFITLLIIDIVALIVCITAKVGPFEEKKAEQNISIVEKI